MRRLFWITLALAAVASISEAGTRYKTITEAGGRSEATEMLVDNGRMRVEATGDRPRTFIFRGDRDEFLLIDHAARTYMVLDRESLEEIADQMREASKQMEEALANMPPGQRASMERMMRQRMGPGIAVAAAEEPVVHDMGETGEAGGVRCTWKRITRGEVVTRESCIAELAHIPGSDDLAALQSEMEEFFETMTAALSSAGGFAPQMAAALENPMSEMTVGDGFPVVTRSYDGGVVSSTTTFEGAEPASLDPAAFEPPPGYERNDPFAEMKRRRGR